MESEASRAQRAAEEAYARRRRHEQAKVGIRPVYKSAEELPGGRAFGYGNAYGHGTNRGSHRHVPMSSRRALLRVVSSSSSSSSNGGGC